MGQIWRYNKEENNSKMRSEQKELLKKSLFLRHTYWHRRNEKPNEFYFLTLYPLN